MSSLAIRSRPVGQVGVRGSELVPIREVFVHGLGGGGPDSICVLPNLISDIDQRNDNGNRADDLSEIGQVIKTHVTPYLRLL